MFICKQSFANIEVWLWVFPNIKDFVNKVLQALKYGIDVKGIFLSWKIEDETKTFLKTLSKWKYFNGIF